MELKQIFDRLWVEYSSQNPSAEKIHELLTREGEEVVNDHIAFRTLGKPAIGISAIAEPFISQGYVEKGEYVFKEKHLLARHFELPGDSTAPRVFISQLILSECSPFIQKVFREAFDNIDPAQQSSGDLIFKGSMINPLSYETYNRMREESEYAAWFYVFGFRANHFTVSINSLKKYDNIIKINRLLKKNGFMLNTSGGEVKGTPADLLQQSSTMADIVNIKFLEGSYDIPSCYYEFAQRYRNSKGELYSGFISKSADKIFESTNFYKKE